MSVAPALKGFYAWENNGADDYLQLVSPTGSILGWIDPHGILSGSLASGGGTIGGSIAATQVAFGSGVNTISGSSNLTFNNTTKVLDLHDTATGAINGLLSVRGTGLGNFSGFPSLINSAVENDSWNYSLTNATAPAGSFAVIALDSSGVFFLDTNSGGAITTELTISTTGGAAGTLSFQGGITSGLTSGNGVSGSYTAFGKSSGSATWGVADIAGTPNRINFPTTTGTSGQVLQTDGANPQQTSWVTPSSSASSLTLSPINLLAGGADAINAHTAATYMVTSAGVNAMTLAAPTVTTDDGKVIKVTTNTAASHTITFTGGTLRSGSAGVTTATFSAFAGSSIELMAWQGKWYVMAQNLIASFT